MAELLVQPFVLGDGAPQLERAAQRDDDTLGGQRLLEELESAELHGAHGIGEIRLAAHHDHGDVRRSFADLLERREPVGARRHHEVEQHHIRRVLDDAPERGVAVSGLDGLESIRLQ